MLHRATSGLGFTCTEIPSPVMKKMIAIYQGWLMELYHPSGKNRLKGKGDISPKMIVMSKSKLFEKFLIHKQKDFRRRNRKIQIYAK